MRPVTRLPYPLASQIRFFGVGLAYGILGFLLAPLFRRPVRLIDLADARILILKPCCLGDLVFATPLLRELRQALPRARIVVAVGPHSRPALAGNPHLDDILDPGTVGSGRASFRDLVRLVRRIRSGRFDACFVLERSAVLNLIPLLGAVPRRVGVDSGGRGFSLSAAVSARPARPESELYLDLLRAVGGMPRSGALEFAPSKEAMRRVDRLVRERIPPARPWVVLHCAGGTNPGMSLPRKRWPATSFRALSQLVLAAGGSVVLVGAPEDREIANVVLAGARRSNRAAPVEGENDDPDVVDLVGQLSLDEVAALARLAAVYVGNDSGPTHLAEAAGARVIALFGPSSAIVYGPRGANAIPLTSRLWCSPCFVDGRFPPCANVICMESISVDRVWREVQPRLRSALAPR